MFVIQASGDFQDAERGGYRRAIWAWWDENGKTRLFATRAEAQAAIDNETPYYEGTSNYNVLAHNQSAGYPPVVRWVSATALPLWAQDYCSR